jgi:CheY-like chemotaxis protein
MSAVIPYSAKKEDLYFPGRSSNFFLNGLPKSEGCRSPKLRKASNLGRVTMLQSTLHAIHFKHILNFGERQVVDDVESERTAIRAAIEARTKFRVCGEASNGVEAIRQANELRPDLVLMDLAMPHMNGLEAAKVLRNTLPTVPVVLLTLHADLVGPRSSVLGVTLVLSKDDGLAPLLRCLERLLGRKS